MSCQCLAEAEDGTGVTTIILAGLQRLELLHLLLQDLVLSFELLVIFFEFLFLLFKLVILKAVVVFLHRKLDTILKAAVQIRRHHQVNLSKDLPSVEAGLDCPFLLKRLLDNFLDKGRNFCPAAE